MQQAPYLCNFCPFHREKLTGNGFRNKCLPGQLFQENTNCNAFATSGIWQMTDLTFTFAEKKYRNGYGNKH